LQAGTSNNELDLVVQRMVDSENVTVDNARQILKEIK